MKTTGKRILALLLVALMLVSVSCSNTTENNDSPAGDSSAAAEETPVEAAPEEPEPTLALESRDFDGRTFSIQGSRWYGYIPLDYVDVVVEDMTGEGLNDAAYNRNIRMGDLYNCKVAYTQIDVSAAMGELTRLITSDDHAFDVILTRGTNASSAVTNGYLADLGTMPNLDFNQPWWYHDAIEQLRVGSKRFVSLGYITTNHMNAVWDVCFNTQMIGDYQLEEPNTLVNEGRWTFDKAIEMGTAVAHDYDGNGVMGPEDIWGIHYTNDTVIGMLNSCGVQIGVMNDGLMEYTLDTPESVDKMQNVLTKLFNEDFAVDVNTSQRVSSINGEGGFFIQGTVLFLFTATHTVWQLRQMDMNFGMLPYPKYQESDDYISTAAGIFNTLVTVPMNVSDPDAVGYFMEAYSYEGWKELKPVYFDKILQGKMARDEKSAEMLDYIFSNLAFDAGSIYNISSMASSLSGLSSTLDTNIASFLARQKKMVQKSVEQFNAAAGN